MIFFQQIRQWLLLLIRTAIIALLAVAFARPFLSQAISEKAELSPRSVVILLDTSMSMQYGDAFDKAKEAVLALLDSFQAGDEAALITFSDGTENVTELTTDRIQLATFVRNLDSPGFKSTGYLPALRLADQTLRSARYPDKTVYLVSDFQRRAVGDVDTPWRLGPGVTFEGIKNRRPGNHEPGSDRNKITGPAHPGPGGTRHPRPRAKPGDPVPDRNPCNAQNR
jgi:hypothetical protein